MNYDIIFESMTIEEINFNKLCSVRGRKEDDFEEFVTQLARLENIPNAIEFTRLDNPDGGLECYWELEDGSIIGWQAKFFINRIGSDQFDQIEESLVSALKNYNLKKVIIVIPKNLTKHQNKLKNKRIKKWKNFENARDDLEIKFWCLSDIIEIIRTKNLEGFRSFWFGELEIPDTWFERFSEETISNFKNKYNPDLCIETDNEKYFNVMSRNEKFKIYFFNEINSYLDSLMHYYWGCKEGINKLNINELNSLNFESHFKNNLNTIKLILSKFEETFNQMDNLDIDKIILSLDNVVKICDNVENIVNSMDIKDNDNLSNLKFLFIRFKNSLISFKDYLKSEEINLINKPFVIFNGEAGIGKSFLFAQTLETKIKNRENCILLMGNQFSKQENPKKILMEELDIKNFNFEDFLDALECKAQIQKSRILILIDALNEGIGVDLWEKYLNSFLMAISKRKWIGCALSIRSEYFNQLELDNSFLSTITLEGFRNHTQEAILKYFEYYELPINEHHLFSHEFYNPLFLKLYCETISNGNIIKNIDSLVNLFDEYLKSVNIKLSRFYKYSERINLVEEILLKLIDNNVHEGIEVNKVQNIILTHLSNYPSFSFKFMDSLIDEGLLNVYPIRNKEYVFITFNLLENFFHVKNLLENKDITKFGKKFNKKSEFDLIYHPEFNSSQELLNMFSIYIPEQYGVEFYDILPIDLKEDFHIINSFVNSLKWRNQSIKEDVFEYIKKFVFKYEDSIENFFKIVIDLAPIENHILNANFTHKLLFNMDLGTRDYLWTIFINNYYNYGDLKNMINFVFTEGFSVYSEDSIKLYSIMLSWFLSSSNRELRDLSTKALVYILKDKINILIEILKKFENINDPYIYERLYAVAYGCTLLNTNKINLDNLAVYIYNTIFNIEGEIYPNILLRDYAKNSIEYIFNIEDIPEINHEKIKPPYKNNVFPVIPPDDEIERLKEDNGAIKNLFLSMKVEYDNNGRLYGIGGFGIDTFQSCLSNWENQLTELGISYYDLMKVALKRIFDLGFDSKVHDKFDNYQSLDFRDRPIIERIGKKYQWIALYELLAKCSDKFRNIEKNFFLNELEMDFDGAWQLFIRDIDPTILNLDCRLKIENPFINLYDNENFLKKDYFETINDLPDPKNLIETKFNVEDKKFNAVILEGHFDWWEEFPLMKDKNEFPKHNSWYQIRCYLIPKGKSSKIINYLKYRDFHGRWMPESLEIYNIFNKEIPNSMPFDFLYEKQYYEIDTIINTSFKVNVPVISGNALTNDSINENRYLKLNKDIFNYLNLSYGNYDSFIYENSNIVGFDFSEVSDIGSLFVFDKNLLKKYADDNEFDIVFTVLGEKIYSKASFDNYFLDFSGLYYYKKDKLNGKLNIYNSINFEEVSTSLVGFIDEIKTSKENFRYYFDEKNDIIYQIFITDDLKNILNFKYEIFKENVKFNDFSLDIGHITEIFEVIDEQFDQENDIHHDAGYILISYKNDNYYVIAITTSQFEVKNNLRGKLFKNHVKFLCNNLKISNKFIPITFNITNKFDKN